ncbi:MAG: hypothetical protein GXY86_09545 [Firmicutes bacterium]|nr:hypothetical protein [Bacillota bacterium]
MNDFYLIIEDPESSAKIYLGEISLDPEERTAMLLADTHRIPKQPLLIPLIYRNPEMSDFLNLKFPLISDKLKNILDEYVTSRIFYRPVFLEYQGSYEPYYYLVPPCYEGIDFSHSDCIKDDDLPGRVKIGEGGFNLRPSMAGKDDIFRLSGLNPRQIIITHRLKQLLTDNGVIGVRYTPTYRYQDGEKQIGSQLKATLANESKITNGIDETELLRQKAQRIREAQAQAGRARVGKR